MSKAERPKRTFPKYSNKELRHMIKTVNDSLYRLERAGLQSESAEYRMIEKYAISNPNGTGKMYNVNFSRGTIRVSKDLSRYKTEKERKKFVEVLENILESKTRTVSGTRKALQKGYETVVEKYNYKGSLKDYINVWHTYRDKVSKDKRTKYGSDKIFELIQKTNIYELNQNQLDRVMEIMNKSRSAQSGANSALKKVGGFKVTKRKLS